MKIADRITRDQFLDIVLAVWMKGRTSPAIEASEFVREIKERLLSAAGSAGKTG